MTVYPIAVTVLAALAVAAVGLSWRMLHRLRRDIRRERATARLMGAAHHRDMEAFRARIRAALADQRAAAAMRDELAVLEAADAIVAAELTRTTHQHPQEGDTP